MKSVGIVEFITFSIRDNFLPKTINTKIYCSSNSVLKFEVDFCINAVNINLTYPFTSRTQLICKTDERSTWFYLETVPSTESQSYLFFFVFISLCALLLPSI